MAQWAYVENGKIEELVDVLPMSWRNVSGLYLSADNLEFLNSIGWYAVVNEDPYYDPQQYLIVDHSYEFLGDRVKETAEVVILPPPEPLPEPLPLPTEAELKAQFMTDLRLQRDRLLRESDWTQLIDTQALFAELQRTAWSEYRQALRDLPQQYADTATVDIRLVVWPQIPN